MTKFLCTKCSGFYNLDCTLETNSPLGLPDRCPFGVMKYGITWEVVEEFPGKDGLPTGSPSDQRPVAMSPPGPVCTGTSPGRKLLEYLEGKPLSDP